MDEKCDLNFYKGIIMRLAKLQEIVLGKEQIFALERLRKPYIDDLDSTMNLYRKNQKNKEEEECLIIYFKEKIENNTMTVNDKILFEDLNPNLKNKIQAG